MTGRGTEKGCLMMDYSIQLVAHDTYHLSISPSVNSPARSIGMFGHFLSTDSTRQKLVVSGQIDDSTGGGSSN